jgi:hypothetical protein
LQTTERLDKPWYMECVDEDEQCGDGRGLGAVEDGHGVRRAERP